MPNEWFQFKQFIIHQDKCAMKVGTDGVLLGAWVEIRNYKKILDVGTGTGLIALMLAQRSQAEIDAVEIDEQAARQARMNVAISPWKERIKVFQLPYKEYPFTEIKYDLIISNPPYFSNSHKAPDRERSMARHDTSLTFEDLIQCSIYRLNSNGILAVIVPADSFIRFQGEAKKYQLFPHRLTFVKPTPASKPKRILSEFGLTEKKISTSELILETSGRHHYSAEYIRLTESFYLHMQNS